MSSALAIAGVTAVLQYYLSNLFSGLTTLFGGTVAVSAKAPDIIQQEIQGSTQHYNQVNLFLHQVTHNQGWRNQGLPSLSSDGKTLLKNPPLALDLHYLLTAYALDNWHAEALLGYALVLLHQNPVLTRGEITNAMAALPATHPHNPLSTPLGSAGLDSQVEMLKITPATLGREEMAWLWTALKADYRPTFPFQVSVVLMEPQLTVAPVLPVRSPNITVSAGMTPQLFQLQFPTGRSAPVQGDLVTITGQSLTGASTVMLANTILGINYPITPTAVTDTTITFTVPNDITGLPAGLYNLSVVFNNPSGLSTNTLPMGVAPLVSGTPTIATNVSGTLVTVTCVPNVLATQNVSLTLGAITGAQSFTEPAQTFVAPNQVSFQFPTLSGTYLVVLSVDGIDSPVSWKATPPGFTNPLLTV